MGLLKRLLKPLMNQRGIFGIDDALIGGGLALAGVIGGSTSKSKAAQPQTIDTRSPEQKAVSAKLAQLLTQGGASYNGARVAGLSEGENYTQNALMRALSTAQPGIDRLLKGEFPEDYFNQAVADPTRRQFNSRVAPVIKENSELTGNRFADRSAIELGQARGDVESSIAAERGKFALNTYRDPINTASTLTSVLANAENIFSVPRTIEQAKLDADFSEFMRTNPDAGGLIEAMLNFTGQSPNAAYVPQQQQSIFPSLIQAGGSFLGSSAITNALNGSNSANALRTKDF